MNTSRSGLSVVACVGVALSALAAWACSPASDSSGPGPLPVTATASAELTKAGKGLALTVLATRLAGKPSVQVGEVVAMMLERAGMTDLQVGERVFVPSEGADLSLTARELGEHVRAGAPGERYTLFTDILGTPGKGIDEVRSVMVSPTGEVVWSDRLVKGEAAFEKASPTSPMDCCVLVARRLRPVLDLGNPTGWRAKNGPIAERIMRGSGVPDKAELGEIEKRAAAFRRAAPSATLLVYPARIGPESCVSCAAGLAEELNRAKLVKAVGGERAPELTVRGDMNEQKVLWSMARSLSAYVKANPPGEDYVLLADYMMNGDRAGAVHFAVCDRRGELVIVDFQNSHGADFKAVEPRTREDCGALVVRRLTGMLR